MLPGPTRTRSFKRDNIILKHGMQNQFLLAHSRGCGIRNPVQRLQIQQFEVAGLEAAFVRI